ncbi:hypothetical protein MKZ38_006496 [Zalerion maritima]|uniref:Uncharacterized protein n=1 Tax=Zalerion maritima TaxID=339359 RepID=A0AAD5RYN5_9PEZI|nr:hypothetical protein MKZ38_006496 [Zalerion maritima]
MRAKWRKKRQVNTYTQRSSLDEPPIYIAQALLDKTHNTNHITTTLLGIRHLPPRITMLPIWQPDSARPMEECAGSTQLVHDEEAEEGEIDDMVLVKQDWSPLD